ncbi:alanine racemase [Rhodobacteraceae bacterium RKSG542]|nr:alanine racemase [Pseudovibrio flavus]
MLSAPAFCGAKLTIHLDRVCANWRKLADMTAPKARCAAVVKADAYGTGAAITAKALYDAGARTFFTAIPSEGITVREVCPDAEIYILGGLFHGRAGTYELHGLRPVLNSLEEIEEWRLFNLGRETALPAAIHIDTGMNRLGLTLDEAEELGTKRFEDVKPFLSLLMTHLSCADEPTHPLNALQLERFKKMRGFFPGVPASMANSAGVFLGEEYHMDIARPGIAVYGGNPIPERENPMQAVASIHAEVVQVRWVEEGHGIGYSASLTATKRSRIAVISAGYADGLHRLAGSSDEKDGAHFFVGGHFVPLAGRVSMDLIALDVTHVPEDLVRRGTLVEVLGDNVLVDDLAKHAHTISYELLTGLGRRYHRVYSDGSNQPEAMA